MVLSSGSASDLGAKVGDVVAVGGAGGLRVVDVVGVARGDAALGRTVLGTSEDIQTVLGRPDQLDAIFVASTDAVDQAALAMGGAEVVTLDEHQATRPDERSVAAKPVRIVLRIVTGLVLAGVLIALYAMLRQVVATRRRDHALLRSVGASPANLRAVVLADALLTSVAAGLLAPLVALALLPLLSDTLSRLGLPSLRVDATDMIGYLPWALLVALGTALVAAIPLAARVARLSPVEAVTDRPTELNAASRRPSGPPRRPTTSLGPLLVVPARIARRELAVSRRRLLPVVVALGVLFGMVVAVVVVNHGVQREASTAVSDLVRADYVVDSGVVTTGGFSTGAVEVVRGIPGVSTASAVRSAGATVDAQSGRLLGIDFDQIGGQVVVELTDGEIPRGAAQMLLSSDVAADLGRGVGESIWIALAGGQSRQLEISGLVAGGPLVSSGIVDRSVFLEDLPASADLLVLLDVDGSDPSGSAAIADRVQDVIDDEVGFGTVLVAEDLIDGRSSMFADLQAVLLMVIGVAVVTALVGLASTMFVAAVGRRREMALLWTAGASGGQRITVAGWQAVVVAVVATVIGAGGGWAVGSAAVSFVFGAWPPTDLVGLAAIAGGFGAVTVVVATLSAAVVDHSAVRRALQLV